MIKDITLWKRELLIMNDSKPVTSIMNAGFVSITAINFVIYLVYYLLMVIIAVVVHTNLHASLAQAGLASGIYVIGTLLVYLSGSNLISLVVSSHYAMVRFYIWFRRLRI